MPSSPSLVFSIQKLEPRFAAPGLTLELPVRLAPSTTYPLGCVLGEVTPTYTLTITATGGTFTLSVILNTAVGSTAVTTAAIAYNASAATMQTALQLVWAGATVTGTGPYTITPPGGYFGSFAVGVASLTGGSATLAAAVTGITSYGMYKPYASGNTDGSQIPKCILPYACATDASSNITMGTTSAGGEFSQTYPTVDAYFSGWFRAEDLPQSGTGAINSNALATANAGYPFFLRKGTLVNGIVQLI